VPSRRFRGNRVIAAAIEDVLCAPGPGVIRVAEYIDAFCNRRRLHSPLGFRTPFETLTDHRAAATATA
jgi:hypothetical protein